MAVWRNNFEPEIKKLIQKVTGFEEFEENFQLCLQFAVSNIRYHRFLDVDSHKVNAAIKGYIEKFSIHSQYEKEKSFRTLVDKFLESPIFEGKDTGKTDTHYSLLLLLFKLSNSPTHQEYTPKILDLQKDDKKREDFDWFAYLMEGVEEPRRFFDDSEDELSSIEGDSEEDIRQSQGLSHSSNIKDVANDLNHSQQAPPFPDISLSTIPHNESTSLAENEKFHGTSEEWLRRNVVVQYWHGQNAPNAADSSNLHRDWRYFRRQVEPLHGNQEQTIITETPLIREILWMLSGVSDLYIFVYNGNAFSIREDVTLSHVTEQCLETYLLEFTRYGSYVQDLLKFQQNVLTQGINFKNSETNSASEEDNSQHWVCQTYQAFVASVDSFIKTLREYLRDLEKAIIKQEETILLGQLLDTLKPWLHKIHLVHSVYEKGIKTVEWSPSPCHRASCLLSIIYEIVIECQNFEEDSLNLMMTIWLDTCKPYLKIIDQWMTKGTLVDPMDEFIVKRNSDVKSLDESFWETAFTIHVPSEESLLADTQGTQFSDGSSLDQSKIRTLISHWAPQFLQPVLLYVVLAGKSMEMLQGMGCLGDVLGNKNNIFCKAIPLYDKFVDSLNTSLSVQSKGQTFKFESRGTGYQLYEDSVKPLMQIKGVYDPLLTINYQTVFMDPMSKLLRESSDFLEDTNYTREKSMPPDETSTLQRTLEDCLYPQVKEQYLTVCRRLVDILKEQYNLLGYLSSMRQFFLMEAGDTMYEFYTQIFEKIRLKEHWRDSSTMNLILQEALAPNFPEEVNRLAIEIETLPPSTVHSPITLTDCLKLHYKVPWPVDVVINTKCQAVYNQVFQFLLQIKRAKYLLDRQRFSELNKADLFENVSLEEEKLKLEQEMPLAGRIHKIQILRMKLLNFVNSLHNYIMTRILHSTGLEFKGDMERAQDLDQIIELHGNYVQKLHERCMMHKKVSFIREAVMKVLNIVLSFHQLWSQNIHHVSVKYIDDMEMDFTRCIQFLATFLNNVIKRGSFPHLESLAFALRMMVVTNN